MFPVSSLFPQGVAPSSCAVFHGAGTVWVDETDGVAASSGTDGDTPCGRGPRGTCDYKKTCDFKLCRSYIYKYVYLSQNIVYITWHLLLCIYIYNYCTQIYDHDIIPEKYGTHMRLSKKINNIHVIDVRVLLTYNHQLLLSMPYYHDIMSYAWT